MDTAPEIAIQDSIAGHPQWFVMRDLTRANAKRPAYILLRQLGVRHFTPMTWKITTVKGRPVRSEVPFMHDLIFVNGSRDDIDPIVNQVPTFQYRFLRHTYRQPMTVRNADMERFIRAVSSTDTPRYLRPDEVTPAMYDRPIRIIGGNLDGYEGYLITTRGSRVKRLLVEIPSLLAATIEVDPEYIQLIDSDPRNC